MLPKNSSNSFFRAILFIGWLGLLAQVFGATVEFNPDRIEENKPFIMSLVVPLREVPEIHDFPVIKDLKGMKLITKDSLDETRREFFRGRNQVRLYRFHLISPKAGNFNLGPLIWKINGQDQALGSIQVVVHRGYDAPGVSVQVQPTRQSVYQGEQLALNLGLQAFDNYQGGLNLSGIDIGNEFWSFRPDFEPKPQRSSKPGVQWEMNTRLAYVSPMKSGSVQIPSLSFNYQKIGKPVRKVENRGNFHFESVTQEPVPAIAKSPAISIDVRPLPKANRPDDFSGLVGQYSFEAKVDKDSLKVGDALTLTLTIRGNGRPGSIPEPAIPPLPDFRMVPPESKIINSEAGGQLWTTREMKIFVYPKKKGDYTIPALTLSYFDPKKVRYERLNTPEFKINVEKGDASEIPMMESLVGVNKKEIETLGSDIRYIKLVDVLPVEGNHIYKQFWYWVLFVCPFGLFFGIGLYRMLKAREISTAVETRKRLAARHLKKTLKSIPKNHKENENGSVCAALAKAVTDYLDDRFATEFNGLTRNEIEQILLGKGVSQRRVNEVIRFLSECERARFSPYAKGADDLETRISLVHNMLINLEKES
jgi:hypothetical protein